MRDWRHEEVLKQVDYCCEWLRSDSGNNTENICIPLGHIARTVFVNISPFACGGGSTVGFSVFCFIISCYSKQTLLKYIDA